MNKMKRIIFILLLALHGVTVFSQGQTLFVDKKYDESLSLSKIEKKPLVIFFYAKWCPHCNVMKKEVFTDSTVTALYRKNFVLMGVDAESEYGKELKTKFQDKFRILSFPTFAFLDNNENLLYCTSGELKKERFLSEGNSVVVPENQIPNIKEAFYSDPSNADKCLKYITVMKKAGFETTKIAQKYLSTIKPEERFTEINWRIFANGINNFDTDEFKFVIQNKDAFSKALSASRRIPHQKNRFIAVSLRPSDFITDQ
jgi:thioredoxin-related protein